MTKRSDSGPGGEFGEPIDALLRQHDELKRRDPDAILLFRVEDGQFGDAYRVFGEDAETLWHAAGGASGMADFTFVISKSGITLAAGDLEAVLSRIVAAGKRAAVCEQVPSVEWIVTEGKIAEDRPGHTPGPWEINPQGDEFFVVGPDDEFIATVTDDIMDEGIRNANARLIAAAPDLLAACQLFMRWDESLHNSEGDAVQLRRTMAAAIANATGSA